jgi:hypothetical protein
MTTNLTNVTELILLPSTALAEAAAAADTFATASRAASTWRAYESD